MTEDITKLSVAKNEKEAQLEATLRKQKESKEVKNSPILRNQAGVIIRKEDWVKATHVGKTLYARQVTACALYCLMYKAFLAIDEPEFLHSTFENWQSQKESVSPSFLFWSITLRFEITVMLFVKGLCKGDFVLYKEALVSLVPCFFALDHPNYARWLP